MSKRSNEINKIVNKIRIDINQIHVKILFFLLLFLNCNQCFSQISKFNVSLKINEKEVALDNNFYLYAIYYDSLYHTQVKPNIYMNEFYLINPQRADTLPITFHF